MKDKLKNPYFWLSTFALIFSASGVDFNQLTSWSLLAEALLGILNNPVSIIAIITAFLGIWNDNSTKGLDKPTIKKIKEWFILRTNEPLTTKVLFLVREIYKAFNEEKG